MRAVSGRGRVTRQRVRRRGVFGSEIGAVEFDVVKPKTRCLATHANPTTGQRDLAILPTLTQKLGQENPTFAVAMMPTGAGGQIRVGDEVALLN